MTYLHRGWWWPLFTLGLPSSSFLTMGRYDLSSQRAGLINLRVSVLFVGVDPSQGADLQIHVYDVLWEIAFQDTKDAISVGCNFAGHLWKHIPFLFLFMLFQENYYLPKETMSCLVLTLHESFTPSYDVLKLFWDMIICLGNLSWIGKLIIKE